MSAFLCSSYHIGRLAAYVVSKKDAYVKYHADVSQALGAELAAEVAAKMAASNVASIQGRYPDTREVFENAPGLITDTQDGHPLSYISLCAQAARVEWKGEHTPADIVQAADCYAYQSCEYEGWNDSEGLALMRLVKDTAVAELMKGFEANGWELQTRGSEQGLAI